MTIIFLWHRTFILEHGHSQAPAGFSEQNLKHTARRADEQSRSKESGKKWGKKSLTSSLNCLLFVACAIRIRLWPVQHIQVHDTRGIAYARGAFY